MGHKSNKPNLTTVTIRLEPEYIADLKPYAQAVGQRFSAHLS
jgi:hypothetical protein